MRKSKPEKGEAFWNKIAEITADECKCSHSRGAHYCLTRNCLASGEGATKCDCLSFVMATAEDIADRHGLPTFAQEARWVEAGFVGVNAGAIVIMDTNDALYDGRDALEKWDTEFLQAMKRDPLKAAQVFHRIKWGDQNGITQEGFVSRSGYGDGYYRIWARLDGHGLPMELRINFDVSYGVDDSSDEPHDIAMPELFRKVLDKPRNADG